MPNLKDIRRRITSVEKTQQITSAMRMVAAAKLRRAEEAIVAARPYAQRMRDTLAEVASSLGGEAEHPLLERRDDIRTVELVVIVSDRGLCGAFNANVLKRADAEARRREAEGAAVHLTLVGRKAVDFFRRRRPDAMGKQVVGIGRVDYSYASEVAQHVSERFESGEVDEVTLLYNEHVSAMTQSPRADRLLPVVPDKTDDAEELPYEIEPSAEALLAVLVPRAVEVQVLRAMLENQAGEHAARMAAMDNATRNTEELIDSLTLQYNRVRQAAITRELVEIVSGAEAL